MYQLILLTSLCLSVDAKCSALIVRSTNTDVGHPLKSIDELMGNKLEVLKKVNSFIPFPNRSKASAKLKLFPNVFNDSFSKEFNNTHIDFTSKQWTSIDKLRLLEIVRSTAFCMIGISIGCTLYLVALLILRLMSTDEALEELREGIVPTSTFELEAATSSQEVRKEQHQPVGIRTKKKNKNKKR